MYGTGTCTVFRIRIQWMQIKMRLVCPDPNCNKAKILDPDSMNQDPKHSWRYQYVPICGSRRTDELSRYRYVYGFSWSGSKHGVGGGVRGSGLAGWGGKVHKNTSNGAGKRSSVIVPVGMGEPWLICIVCCSAQTQTRIGLLESLHLLQSHLH